MWRYPFLYSTVFSFYTVVFRGWEAQTNKWLGAVIANVIRGLEYSTLHYDYHTSIRTGSRIFKSWNLKLGTKVLKVKTKSPTRVGAATCGGAFLAVSGHIIEKIPQQRFSSWHEGATGDPCQVSASNSQ